MGDDDCLFCRIASGDVDAEIVDSDDHTVAFMDIAPRTRGHALVIPRKHAEHLYAIDDESLGHTVVAAKRLAQRMKDRLGCDGINLLNSTEEAAWQTVPHFHVHVIPRYADDPLELPVQPQQPEGDELSRVADELR